MFTKHYFCRLPFNIMKMKNLSMLLVAAAILLASCGKSGKSSKGMPNDGQLHGVAPGNKYQLTKTSRHGVYPTRNLSYGSERRRR